MSEPRPATPKNAQKCPAALLRDLRGAAALLALDEVYLSKGAKVDQQQVMMSDNFHGNEAKGVLSTLKKLCYGKEAFENLFDFQSVPSGTVIYTKQHISADGIIYLMNGESINDDILSRAAFTRDNGVKVTGRTLFDNASKVILANCKKAQSLVPKLVNKAITLAKDGTISGYNSGLNEEDFLNYINDGMWVLLECKTSGETNTDAVASSEGGGDDASVAVIGEDCVGDILGDDGIGADLNIDDDDASAADTNNLNAEGIVKVAAGFGSFKWDNKWMPYGQRAPRNYRFPGYCAYACFGPHTNFFSRLINPNGNSEEEKSKKNTGRTHHRKEEAKKARYERVNDPDRGLTMDNKIKLASLAQQDESNAQRDKETKLLALKVAMKTLEDTRTSKEKMLSIDGLPADMKSNLFLELNNLNDKILQLNEEMIQLSKESRQGTRLASAVLKEAEKRMGIMDDDVDE